MRNFNIDKKKTTKLLVNFISKTVKQNGFSKVILGLSGGIDSACVAYLAVKALGPDNVIGLIMPYGKFSRSSVLDAKLVSGELGIKIERIDISPMVDAYFAKAKDADNLRRGNKMARERMSILYDLSKKYSALVIGTSNKTETLLGYGTLHGDCAWSLNPIGSLYKTQLRAISRYIKVPIRIIDKKPSAGLWPGQTDEDDLGYLYKDIDELLFFMVDKGLSDKQLRVKGFDEKFILDIRKRIRDNKFKSERPAVLKL